MSELQFAKQFLTTLDNKPSKYQPDHAFPVTNASSLRIPYTLPKLPHPPHPSPPAYSGGSSSSSSATKNASSSSSSSRNKTQTITLRLSSSRNPALSLTLHSLPLTTPVAEIKSTIKTHLTGSSSSSSSSSSSTGLSTDKIKILLNKKPIPSTKKTLADALAGTDAVVVDQGSDKKPISLSVMIMGGAADPPADAVKDIYYLSDEEEEEEEGQQPQQKSQKDLDHDNDSKMQGVESFSSSATTTTSKTNHDTNNNEKADNSSNWQDQLSTPDFWDDLQVFLQQRLQHAEGGKKLRAIIEKAWRADVVKIAT